MSTSALSQPTLVLNRSWVAIHATTAFDALKLLFKGAAKAVLTDTYEVHEFDSWADLAVEPHEPHVRTVTLCIRIPEVIVLTRYDGIPSHSVPFTRRNLFRRDRNACQYCGSRPGTSELTIDHVLPRSRGGLSCWDNCVLACVPCNRRKANRTPREAGMRLRREPLAPCWSPTLSIPVGRVLQSWEKFVGEQYWNTLLEP